jgi:hypothetical protein
MDDPLPELHAIELTFPSLISEFYEEYPNITQEFVTEFTLKSAEYSKQLNISLKIYAKIDYSTDPSEKITMNSYIKFAYDLLSLLSSIIRNLELEACPKDKIGSQIGILDDLIIRKQNLILTTYHQAASRELIAFHDKNLRSSLEDQLQKHLENRKSED